MEKLFSDKNEVKFADFLKQFVKVYGLSGINVNDDKDTTVRCLKILMEVGNAATNPVSKDNVARFGKWFPNKPNEIPQTLYALCTQDWYFGISDDPRQFLGNSKPGTYIVRWDPKVNAFFLSFLVKADKDGQPEIRNDKLNSLTLTQLNQEITTKLQSEKLEKGKVPENRRPPELQAVKIKAADLVTGHAGGCYQTPTSGDTPAASAPAAAASQHYKFVL